MKYWIVIYSIILLFWSSFLSNTIQNVKEIITGGCIYRTIRGNQWKYFDTAPSKRLRIVFDLGGTLMSKDPNIEVDPSIPEGERWMYQFVLRDEAIQFLKELKERGHTLIIWTTATKTEAERIIQTGAPELLDLIDEIYTRDDELPTTIEINGEEVKFKDIRLINGDFLIEDDPSFEQIAQQLGLEGYIAVKKYNPLSKEPDSWIETIVEPVQNEGG